MATQESKLIVSLIDRLSAPLKGVTAQMRGMNAAIERNNHRLAAARGQMFDAAAAGWALYEAIKAPTQAAIEWDSALADIRKVVDFPTPAGLVEMGAALREMSLRIPMAATELAKLTAAGGQSGLKPDQLIEFTELAAKVGTAWDIAADVAGQAIAELRTSTGRTLAGTRDLADAINTLGNNTAASAPKILDFVLRAVPMAGQFGFTAEQAAALGSGMISAGFQADVASTSFINMGAALTSGASATKAQRQAYKQLGLTSTGVAKRMQKDAVGTIKDVFARINKVVPEERAAIIRQLFGAEARALIPLITNADLLAEVLGYVADRAEYAGSAEKEFEVASKRTKNALQLFGNEVRDLSLSIGQAFEPAIVGATESMTPWVRSVKTWVQANQELASAIGIGLASVIGLNVALTAARFASLFAFGGILKLAKGGLLAAAGVAKLGGVLGRLVGIGKTAGTTLPAAMEGFSRLSQKAAGNANAATAASKRMVAGMGAAKQASNKMIAGMSSAASSASTAGFATYGQKAGAALTVGFNKTLAIGGLITVAAMVIDDLNKSADERLEQIRKNGERYREIEKSLDDTGPGQAWKKLQTAPDGGTWADWTWKKLFGGGDAQAAPSGPVMPLPTPNPLRDVRTMSLPDISGATAVEQAGSSAGTQIQEGATTGADALNRAADRLEQAIKSGAAALSNVRIPMPVPNPMRPPVNANLGYSMPNAGVAGGGGN